jgi:death-on-curing protein
MPDVRYLTASDVLALTTDFLTSLGYAAPILRGDGLHLLESAVARAQNVAFYAGADLVDQAAALTNGIALNHPFLDGNKRSAFATCLTFLAMNGQPLPDPAILPLAEQIIAMHELTDRTQADGILAAWLREHV